MERGVIVLDNGAGMAKYGLKKPGQQEIARPVGAIANCSAKINKQMHLRVGDEIDSVQDGSLLQYMRPFDRGYLNNWGIEVDVWNRIFKEKLNVQSCKDHTLVLTDAPFTPDPWQNECNEVVFELFEFHSCMRRPASWFAGFESQKRADSAADSAHVFDNNSSNDSNSNNTNNNSSSSSSRSSSSSNSSSNSSSSNFNCLVVDSGFSFSHAFPYINGKCVKTACKRINVGGKMLTNYLKELVSYRQWNMMDEFRLINQVKEETCFVSMDILEQMNMNKLNNSRHIMNRFNKRSDTSRKEKAGAKSSSGGSADSMDMDSNNSNRGGEEEEEEEEEGGESVLLYDSGLLNNYGCLKKRFALPDFQSVTRGFVKDDSVADAPDEQLLIMDTERVSVPELLFRPSDIGIGSAGIAETAFQSLEALGPTDMALAANSVVLVGGNVNLHNFTRRFSRELRSFVPDDMPMKISSTPTCNPSLTALHGMCSWVNSMSDRSPDWAQAVVTRQEYFERGHAHCNAKFADGW